MKDIYINEDINSKVLETTGLDMMMFIYCEEFAEVIQELSKVKRYGIDAKRRNNLAEGLADALICIAQIQKAFNISDNTINHWIQFKQQRAENKKYWLNGFNG